MSELKKLKEERVKIKRKINYYENKRRLYRMGSFGLLNTSRVYLSQISIEIIAYKKELERIESRIKQIS